MNTLHVQEVLTMRLHQLQLWPQSTLPAEQVLAQIGPIQAQEYSQGRRALGLRGSKCSISAIEQLIEQQKIVRSWMFRGTLHFVVADQLRHTQAVLQPSITKLLQPMLKKLEIDTPQLNRALKVIEQYLLETKIATRDEIGTVLEQHKIREASKQRLRYFLHYASAVGLICHGKRLGTEETIVLLDEFLPEQSVFNREETIRTIVLRYFTSHGPASITDAARWTGLTLTEIKNATAALSKQLAQAMFNGELVYFSPNTLTEEKTPLLLLAGFDEYIVGYKNRSIYLPPQHAEKVVTANGLFYPSIISNGIVKGTWKLESKGKTTQLITQLFSPLNAIEQEQLHEAVIRLNYFESQLITLI